MIGRDVDRNGHRMASGRWQVTGSLATEGPRTNLQLVPCLRCNSPTVVAFDNGEVTRCDTQNLTPLAEQRAWLAGTSTYLVRDHGQRQWLLWRTPSPSAAQQLVRETYAQQHPNQVVLAEHACKGGAGIGA